MASYAVLGYWTNGYAVGEILTLVGANSSQANSSGTGVITQNQVLVSATSTQANSSGTGVITQNQVLVSATSIQANSSGTGAITLSFTLTGDNSSQGNSSGTGVITQNQVLVSATSTQINNSGTGIITQVQILVSANSSQANSSSDVSIIIPIVLIGSNCIQLNQCSTVIITIDTRMKVIYNDILYSATLTSTSTIASNFSLANVITNNKGQILRVVGTTLNIKGSWATNQSMDTLILPYSNLTSNSTARIRLYSDSVFTTLIYDSGNTSVLLGNTDVATPSQYSYNGSPLAKLHIQAFSNIQSIQIDIADSTLSWIELGKVYCGVTWTPVYNTEFGLNLGISTTTKFDRTQNGNIYPTLGTNSKNLTLNLNYLTIADRQVLVSILRMYGSRNPVFITIFPNDPDPTKEQLYQIFGRLTNNTISNSKYDIYASSLNIEEI